MKQRLSAISYLVLLTALVAGCGDDKKGVPGGPGDGTGTAPTQTPATSGAETAATPKTPEEVLEDLYYESITFFQAGEKISGFEMVSAYASAMRRYNLDGAISRNKVIETKVADDLYFYTIQDPTVEHGNLLFPISSDSPAEGICWHYGISEASRVKPDTTWKQDRMVVNILSEGQPLSYVKLNKWGDVQEILPAAKDGSSNLISSVTCESKFKAGKFYGEKRMVTLRQSDGSDKERELSSLVMQSLVRHAIKQRVESVKDKAQVSTVAFNSDSTISLSLPRIVVNGKETPFGLAKNGGKFATMHGICNLFKLDIPSAQVLPTTVPAISETAIVDYLGNVTGTSSEAREITRVDCAISKFQWVNAKK